MTRISNLLLIILLVSCSPQKEQNTNHKAKNIRTSTYPELIDSLKLQNKYDSAKWALYCIYCDDTVRLSHVNPSISGKTFGNLDLRLQTVEKKHDSVEFTFYFYIDSIKCDLENTVALGNKFLANGVLFIQDSLARYTTQTTMKYFWQGGTHNRFFNPLQPEVLMFIKNNKDKLNPWFREEAKRRKII